MTTGCYARYGIQWEKQQQSLLAEVTGWTVPADALDALLELHGYFTCKAKLTRNRWAEVDHGQQLVVVTSDMETRLNHPAAAQGFLASTLAHELAHVVLHSGKPARSHHETEAWVWAVTFLAPYWMIGSTAEVKALDGGELTERQRWARIYSLAKPLKVTPSLVAQALRLYGVGRGTNHRRAA